MHAIMKQMAAARRGPRSVHMSNTTITGTIAIRNSDSRFGSAVTAAPRGTALTTSGDEDDTGALVLRRLVAAVVLTVTDHPRQILARLGDVGNPPRRLHACMAGVVGGHRVRDVAAIAVEQPLEMPDPALDVVARAEHVGDAVLRGGRGHQLHQAARTLRRDGSMVEAGLRLDDRLHERVLDVVHARDLADEIVEILLVGIGWQP